MGFFKVFIYFFFAGGAEDGVEGSMSLSQLLVSHQQMHNMNSCNHKLEKTSDVFIASLCFRLIQYDRTTDRTTWCGGCGWMVSLLAGHAEDRGSFLPGERKQRHERLN